MLIKVCGICSTDDAKFAISAGANFLGLIFVPDSKRCVNEQQAKQIISSLSLHLESKSTPIWNEKSSISDWFRQCSEIENLNKRVSIVGVFKDQSIDYINHLVKSLSLDYVQLHGNEHFSVIPQITAPVVRVIGIYPNETTVDELVTKVTEVSGHARFILFDSKGGGSGQTFDWNILKQFRSQLDIPYFLAGGLSPSNIESAIAQVNPFGVDVSSGVEKLPRQKDHAKIKDFIQIIKNKNSI